MRPTTGLAALAPRTPGLVPQTAELGPGGAGEAQPRPGQQLQIPQELQEGGVPGCERARTLPSATLPGRRPPTCSWARRLRSICSSTVGSSRPEGQVRPSPTWGGKVESDPTESLPPRRRCPVTLTCCRAAQSWPRPAGHRKRCWYRAKACLGLQGSPRPPGVAACSMGQGAGEDVHPPPLPQLLLERGGGSGAGDGARRRQGLLSAVTQGPDI